MVYVPTTPKEVKAWLSEVMAEREIPFLRYGTNAVALKAIAEWGEKHPAATRAKAVLLARQIMKDALIIGEQDK